MRFLFLFTLLFTALSSHSQKQFNQEDTLRGSLNENRDWFDIQTYSIHVLPNFTNKSIEGWVKWEAKVVKASKNIQIDLQQPLLIDSILYYQPSFKNKKVLTFKRTNNIAIAELNSTPVLNSTIQLYIYYHGIPREAINPPWDGGWIWKKDANGKPWVSVACQGLGASIWYPCKDHQSDEPDLGAQLYLTIPDSLNINVVANGKEILSDSTHLKNGDHIYSWGVKNPINNYNIIPYVGDYISWKDVYKGLNGNLNLSYYALRQDSAKARLQFVQVPKMLEALEYWFGPYPFYEDGYKLVQSPHLGMEHQSAIGYGNKFLNGYLGRDLSGSGWGLKWDFIIVHESGHEWFGNNITTKDIADMWVHEGFTNYCETLFTEYYYGKEAGNDYNVGIRKNIRNKEPIIGHYGVNEEGSGDMYYKGANLIHSIRHSMNNDSLFRQILLGLNKTFYHKTVTTQEIENFISIQSGFNFQKVFDQYLRNIEIPSLVLKYDAKDKILTYQYKNCIVGFNLPLAINYQDKLIQLSPADYVPQKKLMNIDNFEIANFVKSIQRLYYVNVLLEN